LTLVLRLQNTQRSLTRRTGKTWHATHTHRHAQRFTEQRAAGLSKLFGSPSKLGTF